MSAIDTHNEVAIDDEVVVGGQIMIVVDVYSYKGDDRFIAEDQDGGSHDLHVSAIDHKY